MQTGFQPIGTKFAGSVAPRELFHALRKLGLEAQSGGGKHGRFLQIRDRRIPLPEGHQTNHIPDYVLIEIARALNVSKRDLTGFIRAPKRNGLNILI